MSELEGTRFVVVGGSSGIGRAVALAAAAAGASVIVAARRADRLAEVAAEAAGVIPVQVDLRDEGSCAAFAASVAATFEGVDALFVSAGAAPLRTFAATTTDDWMHALETNLVGTHRVIAGLLPLLAPGSVTAVVSSESASEPRSHLGAYGASKAAVEHMVAQWREEHPWLRCTVISLGGTLPTEFDSAFDGDVLVDARNAWAVSGRGQTSAMATPEVADLLCGTMRLLLAAQTVDMPRVVLRSPSPRSTPAAGP